MTKMIPDGLKARISHYMVRQTLSALDDQDVQSRLWSVVNRRKQSEFKPYNVWAKAFDLAAEDSARYVIEHMLTTPMVDNGMDLLDISMAHVILDGHYLEFGCGYEGISIKKIAEMAPDIVHGFDSFEGLPEAWFGKIGKGSLTTDGAIPDFPQNVRLHKGWFSETAGNFAQDYEGPIAFLHIDCDLYSSTKDVFNTLGDRIVTGTVIQFDEYFNYPGWQQHEFKAFQELVAERNLSYQYIGYSNLSFSVAVQIT